MKNIKINEYQNQKEKEIRLSVKVMYYGWSVLKTMLITAYSSGYEDGHHATVEGYFCGDGKSESHHENAEIWINDNLDELFRS